MRRFFSCPCPPTLVPFQVNDNRFAEIRATPQTSGAMTTTAASTPPLEWYQKPVSRAKKTCIQVDVETPIPGLTLNIGVDGSIVKSANISDANAPTTITGAANVGATFSIPLPFGKGGVSLALGVNLVVTAKKIGNDMKNYVDILTTFFKRFFLEKVWKSQSQKIKEYIFEVSPPPCVVYASAKQFKQMW